MYATDDPEVAADLLDDAIAWCTEAESGPELRRLAKMLRRWHTEILAHHTTGASNAPVEAANLLIKAVKRSGRGFRKTANYRLRILLAGGRRPCDTQPVASIRTRRPRLVAQGRIVSPLPSWHEMPTGDLLSQSQPRRPSEHH